METDEVIRHAPHSGLTGHVNALPDELLALVFMEYLAAHQAEFFDTQDTFKPYAYIRVAHVCRRWRRVALHSTLLWNEITVLSHQECVDTMAVWSKDTPLEIKAAIPQDRIIRALKLVKTARDRVQTLHLFFPANTFAEILAHICAPFQQLRSLELTKSMVGRDSEYVNNLSFSMSLIKPNWPALRNLSVNGFDVTCIYEQVLALESFSVRGPCTLDRQALLHLPQLRALDLSLISLSDPKLPANHVPLPLLERLYLHHNIPTIDYLLDTIYSPSVPFMQIACTPISDARHLSLLSKKLALKLDPLRHMDPPRTFLTLVFTIRLQGGEMQADAFTTDEVFDEKRRHQLAVSLDSEYDDVFHNLGEDVLSFTRPLPLDDVRTLWLGLQSDDSLGDSPLLRPPSSARPYVDAFGRMTHLHTLILCEFTVDFIKSFLSPPKAKEDVTTSDDERENEGHAAPEQCIFPSLHHLTLKRVNFNSLSLQTERLVLRSKAVDTLISMLEARKAHGGEITHLRLHDCSNVAEEVLEKLMLVVEHVRVTEETKGVPTDAKFEEVKEAWFTIDNMSSDVKDDMFSTPLWTTD